MSSKTVKSCIFDNINVCNSDCACRSQSDALSEEEVICKETLVSQADIISCTMRKNLPKLSYLLIFSIYSLNFSLGF